MARPVGSTSHWWTTRKRVGFYLYNLTDDGMAFIKSVVEQLNAKAKARAMGEL